MKRREFSRSQRAAIILRATNAAGMVVCEGCGLVLARKPFEIDHEIAEALIVDKSKPLTIDDGKLLGVECCHRGGANKTRDDVRVIAKAKRVEARHLASRTPSRNPMPGSRASGIRKRMNGTVEKRT